MDFLSVADTLIENVSAFTYQGYDFSNKDEKCLTDLRISHATNKSFELYRVLSDQSAKMKTRRKLLE